jgi:hypothetical protein
MHTILVSYDLKAPGRNYDDLWEHLRSYSDYIKPLESVWILKTSRSTKEVRDSIKKHVDSNDRVLAINISGDAWASYNLVSSDATWLKENL